MCGSLSPPLSAPSEAPRGLRVSEVTSSSVGLEWEGVSDCLEINGVPVGWQVR